MIGFLTLLFLKIFNNKERVGVNRLSAPSGDKYVKQRNKQRNKGYI